MLRKTVLDTITKYKLIGKGDAVILGLSGGPDSSCLFDVLLSLRKELDITIHPVHVNHKFRPGAAERDQAYVEDLCRRHDMECRSFVVDCAAMAKELGMTSEEAGRKARYDAFYQVAQEVSQGNTDNVVIAVAQNANDQAETILFRLLRGTGTDGLAGIEYERQERGIRVVRPLLDVYRDEIEAYCEEKELDPVIDHTNSEAIYARNKIRLELLPYLEAGYNENMKEALVRLGHIAAADKDYIWQETEKAYGQVLVQPEAEVLVCMDREKLAGLHEAIRHRVLFKAFAAAGLEKDISAERLKAADKIILKKQGPKVVEFPYGYRLRVAKGRVEIRKN